MTDKRYQVFISSTFEDLKEERRAVQDVVISTGDFPVQMESFPAADEDQFEFIRALIDKCDYYILIIAGRYGAVAEDGLSYTHKEFRYAISQDVPVLIMLHGNRGKIPSAKCEPTDNGKARLDAFIKEAENGRLRKTWETLEALKLAVREALDNAKVTKPRVGWVRGDSIANVAALEELNEVRKENDRFKKVLGELEIELAMPPIPAADDPIVIDLLPFSEQGSCASIRTTWIAAFPVFFSNLDWATAGWGDEHGYHFNVDDSCIDIGSGFAGEVATVDTARCFKVSKGAFDRLTSYYIEVRLLNPQGAGSPFTETAERLARRHRINGGSASAFEIVKGEVNVSSAASPSSSDIDDEIPF